MGGMQGVTQGDNVKLSDDEGSGAWETGGGVLQGERGSSTSASAGLSCSSTIEMDGSECAGAGGLNSGTEAVLFCVETVSGWCAGLPSAWVSSESTSLTGEKQRETFTVSFLFLDD